MSSSVKGLPAAGSGRGLPTPAAATSTSTAPSAFTHAAIIASLAASSVVSVRSASALPPAASTARAVWSAAAWSRSATHTLAPSPTKRSAHARPMPLPPPVITAILSASRPGMSFSLSDHPAAAVDQDRLAGDVARVVAGQERDHSGHVLGLRHVAHGHTGAHLVDHLFG